jgi:transcriptional regulator of acetoin/glycerol metabolism
MDYLLGYSWPGNVIQLENVIERAFALGVEGVIQIDDLPAEIRAAGEISRLS